MKNKIINIIVIISVFSLVIGVKAASTIAASQVTYNGSTVKAQMDELFNIVNNMAIIDPNTYAINNRKTIHASSKGVYIQRNNKFNHFKINNYSVEKNHIQQVFSDVGCDADSSFVMCASSDFECTVYSNGSVSCFDMSDYSGFSVSSSGAVTRY